MSQAKQTRRYVVSGLVQGVGFRMFTQRAAVKLRISGYVRNCFDGRVEVLATGTSEQLAQFRAVLEQGPRFSSVSTIQEQDADPDPDYTDDFQIA